MHDLGLSEIGFVSQFSLLPVWFAVSSVIGDIDETEQDGDIFSRRC